MMKKIHLTITGCQGRMGKQLIKSAVANKNFKLVSLTENRKINKKTIRYTYFTYCYIFHIK